MLDLGLVVVWRSFIVLIVLEAAQSVPKGGSNVTMRQLYLQLGFTGNGNQKNTAYCMRTSPKMSMYSIILTIVDIPNTTDHFHKFTHVL